MSALFRSMGGGGGGGAMMRDDDYEGMIGADGFDEDELQDEMIAAAMGARGGQLSQQATADLYAKKLIHRDFYNGPYNRTTLLLSC